MNRHRVRTLWATALVVLLCATAASGQAPPTLTGKVVFADEKGALQPLSEAVVLLFQPGNDTQALKRATTAPDGQFAFYDVAAGEYVLKITFGSRQLKFANGAGPADQQKISVTNASKTTTLPDVKVLK